MLQTLVEKIEKQNTEFNVSHLTYYDEKINDNNLPLISNLNEWFLKK